MSKKSNSKEINERTLPPTASGANKSKNSESTGVKKKRRITVEKPAGSISTTVEWDSPSDDEKNREKEKKRNAPREKVVASRASKIQNNRKDQPEWIQSLRMKEAEELRWIPKLRIQRDETPVSSVDNEDYNTTTDEEATQELPRTKKIAKEIRKEKEPPAAKKPVKKTAAKKPEASKEVDPELNNNVEEVENNNNSKKSKKISDSDYRLKSIGDMEPNADIILKNSTVRDAQSEFWKSFIKPRHVSKEIDFPVNIVIEKLEGKSKKKKDFSYVLTEIEFEGKDGVKRNLPRWRSA